MGEVKSYTRHLKNGKTVVVRAHQRESSKLDKKLRSRRLVASLNRELVNSKQVIHDGMGGYKVISK